ncbi:MAG: oligosaccharide flippase family protein, partial [Gemmatimonadales bacterium]
MNTTLHTGRRVATSIAYNAVGQGLPLLVGLLAFPQIVRGLGTEGFGAFQLAWVVLGTLTLLDLGLPRAVGRFAAGMLATERTGPLPGMLGAALRLQLMLGVAAGVALTLAAPRLVTSVFAVPAALESEMVWAIRLVAMALPAVLASGVLSGVLQAAQRFDLVSLIHGSMTAASYALPLLVLAVGGGLVEVVATFVATRLAAP